MKSIFKFLFLLFLCGHLYCEPAIKNESLHDFSNCPPNTSIGISPDGKYLSIAQNNVINIYETDKYTLYKTVPATTYDNTCFSRDSKYLYYIENKTVSRFNMDNGKIEKLDDIFTGTGHQPVLIETTPNKNQMIAGINGNSYGLGVLDETTKKWEKFKCIKSITPFHISFSPDGKFVAVIGANGQSIGAWNFTTGEPLWEQYIEYDDVLGDIGYSTDGKKIYCCGTHEIFVIDAATGNEVTHYSTALPKKHDANANSKVFPEKNIAYYIMGGPNFHDYSTLYIVELSSGKIIEQNVLPSHHVYAPCFRVSDDGKRAVVGFSLPNTATTVEIDTSRIGAPKKSEVKENKLFDELTAGHGLISDGYNQLILDKEGIYYVQTRHNGTIAGNFTFNDNMLCFEPPYKKDGTFTFLSRENKPFIFEGKYKIDLNYSDFSNKYMLIDSEGNHFPIQIPSECNRTYDYHGVKVLKLKDQYIFLESNMKMRLKPSLKSPTASLPLSYYKAGWIWCIENRQVIFKNSLKYVMAETVEKSTIDGITAPWLLVSENGKDVWIFGGYGIRISEDQKAEYEKYRKIESEMYFQTLLENGLQKSHYDDGI